ncbi:hypothetical protein [Nocardioides sp.]|uniref:hypothetical protein n=1 Tax=Nocardioides sp. TaxID=35761 RepID=UPI00271A2666|nr:hypothetical protein [Nocardioides sp.]MDO9456273.1 hypothetical protein [Nocardioides sp.]
MTQEPVPRRAKHLIDPTAPRKQTSPDDLARLERVQRTVMSVLVGTTIFHLSVGLVIAAVVIDDSERVAQVGLCLLGGAFGVVAIAAAFAIHRRALVSPWLLLGFVPTFVGLVVILG